MQMKPHDDLMTDSSYIGGSDSPSYSAFTHGNSLNEYYSSQNLSAKKNRKLKKISIRAFFRFKIDHLFFFSKLIFH
jgi:hypothetical protein